jgi:kynureninase
MIETRGDAATLDAADPLAGFRDAFELPAGVIYLDGNSLGALPKVTAGRVAETVRDQWGRDLIRSWNTHDWIGAPLRVGGKIAALIGADAHEVIVADSTSVNLFKLAAGAVALRPGRTTILSEPGNFPTDLYVLQGLGRFLDGRARLKIVAADDLADEIDEDTAVVVLTHVHYKSGRRWDLEALTARAHERGALILWDLSHSVGCLDVRLNAAGADLAVGCGYKYLNGGPGAPAFAFVAERHQAGLASPLSGWMGHAEPFAFDDAFRPAGDIRAQLCGTPSVLGLAALEPGVDLHLEADRALVEAKGLALGDAFIELVERRCEGLTLASPREGRRRGHHVSFTHPDAYAIVQALIARGVIGDFRAPDIARFGFSALYTSFAEVWDAVEILREVLATRAYDHQDFRRRAAVT